MKKSVVFSIHFSFWCIIGIIFFSIIYLVTKEFSLPGYSIPSDKWRIYKFFLSVIGLIAIPFYISFYYTKLIIKNSVFLIYPLILIVTLYFIHVYWEGNNVYRFVDSLLTIIIIVFFAFLGGLFQFLSDWFKNNKRTQELEKENQKSKLALLRNQINPHFLYNTLNNIDALIKVNHEKASQSLIKLSDIMRYMLHDNQTKLVLFNDELEYIENYISLEKLRIKNQNFINFKIDGNHKEIRIAPMIFIPFIENAFKHSIDSDSENGILINFTVNKNIITFICKNYFDSSDSEKDKSHGIGLNTVMKRLELLYPNKHNLVIDKNDAIFKVTLVIEFNED